MQEVSGGGGFSAELNSGSLGLDDDSITWLFDSVSDG
jgi:hypothetical protein